MGKGIVHAAKIAMGRQLTIKAMEKARSGSTRVVREIMRTTGTPPSADVNLTRTIGYRTLNGGFVVSNRSVHADAPHKVVSSNIRTYDAQGHLVRRDLAGLMRGERAYEYMPAGRFVGKRVKKK